MEKILNTRDVLELLALAYKTPDDAVIASGERKQSIIPSRKRIIHLMRHFESTDTTTIAYDSLSDLLFSEQVNISAAVCILKGYINRCLWINESSARLLKFGGRSTKEASFGFFS